ncbi:hypothetical protein VMCG_10552 [Cytospora schulzeri]|uniref:Uncharacterized protein n=1 Tax=Cytospora schulzeri TaxID=448051 RepID=A0A423VAD0_9PEZI|nr:hypothetical protein VMCG_10552 [Valsa malicola]
MAGVCLGNDVQQLLKRFDGLSEIPLGMQAMLLQSLDPDNTIRPFMEINRIMTSWDALYSRLRANFDFRANDYVPQPPVSIPLADIKQLETGQLMVCYKDYADGGKDAQALADLVLGADGPNSVVRRMFLKSGQATRKYCGYVAWRGVVPEEQVSLETREIFQSNITYSILKSGGGHVIIYNIPGEGGSIEPGKRLLNFCWYTNVPATSLDEIMNDVNGTRHHTQLAPGQVRPEIWEKQKDFAKDLFAPPYLEVIEKIDSPFLHQITDYCSPRTSFAGGKVLIVGDAVTLLRPHIAFSTNQAAYHTTLTEKLVKGELNPTGPAKNHPAKGKKQPNSGGSAEKQELKILMLHGYAQTGPVFRSKTGAMSKMIAKALPSIDATRIYPTGPHRLQPSDIPGFQPREGDDANAELDCFGWFLHDEEPGILRGFAEGMNAIANAIEEAGGVDGVLGFSQGGAVAALVAAALESDRGLPEDKEQRAWMERLREANKGQPLQFCVIYSGFVTRPGQ